MAQLTSFTFLTLNGFYKGPGNDISWHQHGGEEAQFSVDSLKGHNTLIFGRKTYQLMASFWPTPMAAQAFPEVADGMNKASKIVFSKTLKKVNWENTRILRGNLVNAVKKLKSTSTSDLTILGSGQLVTQLAAARLIDKFIIMIDPVALGKGTPLFQGIYKKLDLKLTSTQTFKSGILLLTYQPTAH